MQSNLEEILQRLTRMNATLGKGPTPRSRGSHRMVGGGWAAPAAAARLRRAEQSWGVPHGFLEKLH